jgi:ABC-type amino acid transport system permease subunit
LKIISLQLEIFIIAIIGYIFARKGIITKEVRKKLTDIVIDLILPCAIIKSFMMKLTPEIIRDTAIILKYATIVSNAGFMGLPIVESIYGQTGLLYASIALIPQIIFMWSAGLSLFTQTDSKNMIKKVAFHPCIIAVYIGLPYLGFNLDSTIIAVIIISLYHGAYISEVVRSGIESVSRGQFETAESQGFTFVQTIIYIILPQTIKLVIPQLLQTIITIFKDSSYLSTIGVVDFMYQGRRLMAHFFQADQIMFIFVYMAGIYFIINFGLSLVVRHMTSKKREAKKRMKLSRKLQTV